VAVSAHALQLALGRYFWAINLAFIAGFAYVGASFENIFVAELIRPTPQVATGSVGPPPKPVTHAELTAEGFARLMGAKLPEAPPPEATEEARPPDMSSEPIRTNLHAQLLATVIANRPEWSIATIKDLTLNETKICMVGDKFMGADVLEIQYLKVILLVDGHREFLDLSAPPSTVAVATPKLDQEAPAAPTGEGIKKLDEHRYAIERSTVNSALSNMNDLAMQARIVPSFKNGQPNGFKLFSIRPDSLYSKIGIQNGDVIQRINGFDMNSPDKALEAYTKLKAANAIDMQVERNGQTVTYHYGIQ